MNKTSAIQWLKIAYHDLQSAIILYEANHYTDSIGNDLQQAIEKILKSLFAFKNQKIPKTHNLYELYDAVDDIKLEDYELDYLDMATEYLKDDRYPNPNYFLPPKEEIKEVLDFTNDLMGKVCKILNIDKKELK